MIISNSNAAKAKQKMGSYSHRGAKAGRASVSSYLLDNAVVKVGDHFASGYPLYLSEDYKTDLLGYFNPKAEQLDPETDIILASFSLDNPGEIASFDVALDWEADYEIYPEPHYYNYVPHLYTVLRNSEGDELRRAELDIYTGIGVFTYNADLTTSYVHYIFDAVVSKVRLGGYTEDALNIKQDDAEFSTIPFVQRVKAGVDVAGKTLKFSNEFFEMFTEVHSPWTFVENCCASARISPVAGANITLVQFSGSSSSYGANYDLVLSIINPATYEFAIMLYTPDENIMIAKYITKSNGEGAWIIDNVSYRFPGDAFITIVPIPVNNYFWNIRSDLITLSTSEEAVDTNIFYTSVITGTGPALYDSEQMLNRLADHDTPLLRWNINNTENVTGLIRHTVLFVDTSHLDPQYGFPAETYCLQLVHWIDSGSNRTLYFNVHGHDNSSSMEVAVIVSVEDGLQIQDVAANGNTIPFEYLDQLRWCIGIIESGQGFKRAVST